jgi:tRNA-specific 2-thiouridylase
MRKQKVLVAMSGGVDSSVAALLLKKQGYNITGAFMKNWSGTKNELGECSWKEDRKEAMKIAAILNIPLITLDFEKQYKKFVVDEMFRLYRKGVTPNPDIDCNQKIKFPLLWKTAKKLGADFIATGHHARIKALRGGGRGERQEEYCLFRAKDESKDQSYFLYRLSQDDLKHSLFPIGNYTKKQVRKIAKKNGFPNFNRKGTVGICFIGKVNLKNFLQKKIKPKFGKILDPEGNIIGQHDGIYYYTIGQRLGPRFGIKISKKGDNRKNLRRWYVARKNLRKNEIIAVPEGHELLYRKEIIIKSPHWISETPNKNKTHKIYARIRQVGELLPSTLSYNKKKKQFKVTINKGKKGITGVSEGQAVVLYQPKSKKVLGGGIIGFE